MSHSQSVCIVWPPAVPTHGHFCHALQSHHHPIMYRILVPTSRESGSAARGAPQTHGMFKRNSNDIQRELPELEKQIRSGSIELTTTRIHWCRKSITQDLQARSTATAFEGCPRVVKTRPSNVISDARSASLIGSCCPASHKCETLELQSSTFP